MKILLGVNIDHVATIRNARGGNHPCVVESAVIAQNAGADGITLHLREDRRHIKDHDLFEIKQKINLPINLEMAPTNEMLAIAIKTKPHSVCLVPEKRHEITTEGGLDIAQNQQKLAEFIIALQQHNILVSLFLNANLQHIEIAKNIGANIIELHTGEFCHNFGSHKANDLYQKLVISANFVKKLGLSCHAGHGLNYQTAFEVAKIKEITELNIGHFIIGESIFYGLPYVVQKMQKILKQARE